MKIFELPISTEISRTVPKNSFDGYATSRHRKRFSELVERIRWTNKLSRQTVNLTGRNITEIQFFHVELRHRSNVPDLLDLIDKAIPYSIVFVVSFDEDYFVRAAAKHPHPANENIAVLDWVFQSDWIKNGCPFRINLKTDLDFVWSDLCRQISGKRIKSLPIDKLVIYEQRIAALEAGISKLETSLKQARQFNRKVELNVELKSRRTELEQLYKELNDLGG